MGVGVEQRTMKKEKSHKYPDDHQRAMQPHGLISTPSGDSKKTIGELARNIKYSIYLFPKTGLVMMVQFAFIPSAHQAEPRGLTTCSKPVKSTQPVLVQLGCRLRPSFRES